MQADYVPAPGRFPQSEFSAEGKARKRGDSAVNCAIYSFDDLVTIVTKQQNFRKIVKISINVVDNETIIKTYSRKNNTCSLFINLK